MTTVEELVEELKRKIVLFSGASPDSVILFSKCHEAPILKIASMNDLGYVYVCERCMEPITVICCKVNRSIS